MHPDSTAPAQRQVPGRPRLHLPELHPQGRQQLLQRHGETTSTATTARSSAFALSMGSATPARRSRATGANAICKKGVFQVGQDGDPCQEPNQCAGLCGTANKCFTPSNNKTLPPNFPRKQDAQCQSGRCTDIQLQQYADGINFNGSGLLVIDPLLDVPLERG
ncbi:hypothetical protein V8E36_005135 [Tilletia maclaganii]